MTSYARPTWLLSSERDKNICEAYGCNNIATNQVSVKVGRHGIIELNLCKKCKPTFEEHKESDRSYSGLII